jgi:hypothetical protein
MRPRPPRVRGALSSTCRVPACHTSVASQSPGREHSRWMPIFHIRQWRQVSACPDAPCGSSTVTAEQLTQKTLGILGLMWPRNIRCGDTARCAAMDAKTRAFRMWSTAGTQVPAGTAKSGRIDDEDDAIALGAGVVNSSRCARRSLQPRPVARAMQRGCGLQVRQAQPSAVRPPRGGT